MGPASAFFVIKKKNNKNQPPLGGIHLPFFFPRYFYLLIPDENQPPAISSSPAFCSRAVAPGLEKESFSPKTGGLRYKMDYQPLGIKLQVSLTRLFVTVVRRLVKSDG